MRNFYSCSLIGVGLAVMMAGCTTVHSGQTTGQSQTVEVAPVSIEKDAEGRPVGDEIAKFAVNIVPGKSFSVNKEGQGRLLVNVGEDYTSATGEKCRRLVLNTGAGEAINSAVCWTNGAWRTVLIP